MKRKIMAVLTMAAVMFTLCMLTGCTLMNESDRVTHNISKEADNFNVCCRITVINSRTDRIVYELEGVFSLKNSYNDELEVICKTGENEYKKHFIYLTDTVLYVVEDMSGADISPYHYEVTFYPQMFVDGVVDFEIGD